MTDPGFVAAAIAELVRLVITETSKVVMCQKHCNNLGKEILEPLRPVVERIISHPVPESDELQVWMLQLKTCLEDARRVIGRCSVNENSWNPITRYKLTVEISRVTQNFQRLQQQSGMVNLSILLPSTNIQRVLDDMADDLKRHSVAATTRMCFESENHSEARAFFEIKSKAVSDSDGVTADMPSSSQTENPVVELQRLPDMVFGVDETRQLLENRLTSESSSKWVGLWGKGGSGKTLLAMTANNSPVVQNHFKGQVYWVTVARRPNVTRKQADLWKKIVSGGYTTFESREDGKTKLYNRLLNTKVLIILDDVWEPSVLEWLDVVSMPGSRILVTSRNRDVLQRVAATELVIHMLSPENSLKLFCVHAFPGEDPEAVQNTELSSVVRELADECKGLPLALKVTGASLAGKKYLEEFNSTLVKMKRAEVLGQEQENELYGRLKLSYDELKTVDKSEAKALQQCFLYFAAFPEDENVEVDQLVDYWIGEGLIKDDDPLTDAYYLVGELISRSMIELEKGWSHAQSMKFLTCKVHDVLRDLALYILQPGSDMALWDCLFQAGRDLNRFPWSDTNNLRPVWNAQRLSLMSNALETIPRMEFKAPNMRVLLLNENKRLERIEHGFLRNFANLQVLDLSGTSLRALPRDVGRLKKLMVLNVSYSSLTAVPSSIGKLRKLEHLNMQQCGSLRSFPLKALSKLSKLKYLNSRGCANIWDEQQQQSSFPANILACCVAPEQIKGLDRLSSLKLLTKLWVSSTKQDQIPTSFSNLVHLKQLSIYFSQLKVIPDELQSLTSLEILDLNTCMSLVEVPAWISRSFASLQSLDLRGCRRLTNLPPLDELQYLRKLDLSVCQGLDHLPASFVRSGAFPCLQELWLMLCTKLEELPLLEPGALRQLSLLDLTGCGLEVLHDSFQVLTGIVYLKLGNCERLRVLPKSESFARLSKMEELILKKTRIREVPASIAELPCLKKLDLSGCQELERLPWNDDRASSLFSGLEEVFLQGSGVVHVPISLAAAPSLKKLNLTGCKDTVFSSDLASVLGKSNVHVMGWPGEYL